MLNERFAGQHSASKNLQAESSPEPSQSGATSEVTSMQLLGRIERLAQMLGEAEGYLIMLQEEDSIELPANYRQAISMFIDRIDDYFDGDY